MAKTKASLHVKKRDESPGTGWLPSSQAGFFYQFTGGNTDADDGTIEFEVGKGTQKIKIRLSDSTRDHFTITDAKFLTTEGNECQITPYDQDDRKYGKRRKFKDVDTAVGSGCFQVTVKYTKGGAETDDIVCDPAWRNKA